MADICTDNRFELIAKYKAKLIEATNIDTDKDEMKAIDNILFRLWQMGWLDRLESDAVPVVRCKDCKHHDDEEIGMVYCPKQIGGWVKTDWFCADGERKEEE